MPDELKFYTVKDIARILSLSERTVRRLLASGKLRKIKVGGRVLVSHDDLMEIIAKQNETDG